MARRQPSAWLLASRWRVASGLGLLSGLFTAFFNGLINNGTGAHDRTHALITGGGLGPANGLVGISLLKINDLVPTYLINGLAADIAGNDGLTDQLELLVLAIPYCLQALAPDHLEVLGVILTHAHPVAFDEGGNPKLKTLLILGQHESVRLQHQLTAGHDHLALQGALALDIIMVQGVGNNNGIVLHHGILCHQW